MSTAGASISMGLPMSAGFSALGAVFAAVLAGCGASVLCGPAIIVLAFFALLNCCGQAAV